ncbi:hypothetical protein C0Q88_07575 [Ralstonia pickettii]|uniref:Uncharacterized protein n=1 Tax=Ralstonia pickettii TaxID=329 RepID=A0A2N4TXV6_RALPI|nr:hypothetical protein [Ralstonia pickettii]PLC44530.1 hypothetical protein C0Q88_07575 [Ralstonia pickettii]
MALSSDDWKQKVVEQGLTICPVCESSKITYGACGVGAFLVRQEYVCEACGHEFEALFTLLGCYAARE